MGAKIILCGDPRGKFLPIYDRWMDEDLSSLGNSLLLYDLCSGLKIELEIYRRGVDQARFDFYFSFDDVLLILG